MLRDKDIKKVKRKVRRDFYLKYFQNNDLHLRIFINKKKFKRKLKHKNLCFTNKNVNLNKN